MIDDATKNNTRFIDRLKSIFQQDPITGEWDPRFLFINQYVLSGSIAGFFIGGRIGARLGGIEHIETTKLAVYQSKSHALREYQGRIFLGFLKNGCKYGWRAGVFSGVYAFTMIALNETKLTKHEALNYIGAGCCTGVIYKSLSGWRSMLVGGIIGSLLSVPVAGLVSFANAILPPDERFNMSFSKVISEMQPKDDFSVDVNNLTEEEARLANLSVTDNIVAQLEKTLEDDISEEV